MLQMKKQSRFLSHELVKSLCQQFCKYFRSQLIGSKVNRSSNVMVNAAFTSLFNQTQNNICTLTQSSILQNNIYSTVWFCMKEIFFRWGDALKLKPKPDGLSSNKLFCAVFSIVRDNAVTDTVINKWTILFEIKIQLFK